MTVDHKAMREALDKATPGPWKYNALINGYGVTSAGVYFEQVAFVAENSGVKKDREQAKNNAIVIANAIEWLRQLLCENQAQEKKIEQLQIERDNLKASIEGCKGIEDYYRIQCRLWECQADKASQAKEIDRIEQERNRLILSLRSSHERKVYDLNHTIKQLQADKAAAVNTLKWIAETTGDQELRLVGCPSMARTTLQRIESGESK